MTETLSRASTTCVAAPVILLVVKTALLYFGAGILVVFEWWGLSHLSKKRAMKKK
jgi:hypothetical protein